MAGTKTTGAEGLPGGKSGKMSPSSAEREAVMRAGHAISAMEDFLSAYERAAVKPEGLAPQVIMLRGFHDALRAWRDSGGEAKERLRELELICECYSTG